MDSTEKDRVLRAIFARVTPETILTETLALAELGFATSQAFELLVTILADRTESATKGQDQWPSGSSS